MGPEAWLLVHPWDGLELAALNSGGLKLMIHGPLRKTKCWSPKDRKQMRPAKSPESCPCSATGGVDSYGVSSIENPRVAFVFLPPTSPVPFWGHPRGGSHPAALLSALSLQCCRSLSSLLTRPDISRTWTLVRPALCGPGEKEAATVGEPFPLWARPSP